MTGRERSDRISYSDGLDTERVAGKLAAKEAVFKVLGQRAVFVWTDVEIVPDSQGAPTAHLHGSAARRASGRNLPTTMSVSISHDGGYAIAVAAALTNDDQGSVQ